MTVDIGWRRADHEPLGAEPFCHKVRVVSDIADANGQVISFLHQVNGSLGK
ncbi:hypothetical protein D3C71_2230060 [compost metagenome]